MAGWLMIAAVAGCGRADGGAITATGTVELLETEVAPSVAGRVSRSWVEEGAHVRAGDTLVTLVSPTLPADLGAREARLARAEAELEDLARGARRDEIERAEAELRSAGAEAEKAAKDLARAEPLAASGAIAAQQLDAARAAARSTAGRRDAARQAVELLRAGPRAGAMAAARARVAEATADVAAARRTSAELTLVAPSAGIVLSRWVEAGEQVAPDQPVLSLGDATRPWARVYVNQRDLPRVIVGDPVTGTLDGMPDRPLRGRVVAINPEAEFSPRVALTEDERADLVFGVKVEFPDSAGVIKAGLPITVRFGRAAAPERVARGAEHAPGRAP
jgi:HlyD family secretion protein